MNGILIFATAALSLVGAYGPIQPLSLLGGTCSASSYCVAIETCNPYNGFIIRNLNEVPVAIIDQPQVPLIKCFVPAGGFSNGVCCQESHPIAGQ